MKSKYTSLAAYRKAWRKRNKKLVAAQKHRYYENNKIYIKLRQAGISREAAKKAA